MRLPPDLKLGRSSKPAVSWSTFFAAVKEALELHLQAGQVPAEKAPLFVEDYPRNRNGKFDTELDVILFRVVESVRAATSPDGQRRPHGFRERESIPHPEKSGYQIKTFGWSEELTVEFSILSKSNAAANKLVEWFHRFMMLFAFLQYFKARGVNDFRFDRRLEDKKVSEYGQELYQRTLRYCVRLEMLVNFEVREMEYVTVTLNGNPEFRSTVPPGEPIT